MREQGEVREPGKGEESDGAKEGRGKGQGEQGRDMLYYVFRSLPSLVGQGS